MLDNIYTSEHDAAEQSNISPLSLDIPSSSQFALVCVPCCSLAPLSQHQGPESTLPLPCELSATPSKNVEARAEEARAEEARVEARAEEVRVEARAEEVRMEARKEIS